MINCEEKDECFSEFQSHLYLICVVLSDSNTAKFLGLSMFNIALAVALGAFGAHQLKAILSEYKLSVFEKACDYLVFQSLGIMLLLLLKSTTKFSLNKYVPVWLLIGTYVFSISVGITAFSELDGCAGLSKAGIIAPLGGLSMILAWTMAAVSMFKWRAKQ
jgi:uncharacterized membrane protein YgdD (TMEM256/DUF423 family)